MRGNITKGKNKIDGAEFVMTSVLKVGGIITDGKGKIDGAGFVRKTVLRESKKFENRKLIVKDFKTVIATRVEVLSLSIVALSCTSSLVLIT